MLSDSYFITRRPNSTSPTRVWNVAGSREEVRELLETFARSCLPTQHAPLRLEAIGTDDEVAHIGGWRFYVAKGEF